MIAVAACRTTGPVALPTDWEGLSGPPSPFVALYRMRCCGRGDLLLTVRGGDGNLSLAVSSMPGGALLESWTGSGGSWTRQSGETCRSPLPSGRVFLGGGAEIPLEPRLAGFILAGRVPEGGTSQGAAGSEVAATLGDWWLRTDLAGAPPRCTAVAAGRIGDPSPLLLVSMSRHRGSTPGRLVLTAGSETLDLQLVEWRDAGPPSPPAWLETPVCGEDR